MLHTLKFKDNDSQKLKRVQQLFQKEKKNQELQLLNINKHKNIMVKMLKHLIVWGGICGFNLKYSINNKYF